MNLKELKEILQILDEKEITEFELEEEGMKLRIRKARRPQLRPAAPPPAPAPRRARPVAQRARRRGRAEAAGHPGGSRAPLSPERAKRASSMVKSPIVGTFYRSPDPSVASLRDVGDRSGWARCSASSKP